MFSFMMIMTVSDSFIFHETFTASQVMRTSVQNTKSRHFNRKVKLE